MNADRDLMPALRGWLADADRDLPEHVRANVLAAVASHDQPRRRWLISWPGWPAPRARLRATALVAIGVALLALLTATMLLPLAGSPAETPVPKLGGDLPEGARSGVIETPLGPARWVHLSGDRATLPSAPRRMEDADGQSFTAVDVQRDDDGNVTQNLRWESDDGLHWTSEPIEDSIEAGAISPFEGAGAFWRETWQPSGLWRSTDGSTWQPIDLTTVVADGPAALEWEVEPGSMASTDTTMLVAVTMRALEPFETLGWPLWSPERVREVEPGLIAIRGRGDSTDERLLRFEATPAGMRVIEVSDGSVVTELEGVTWDDVGEWVRRGLPDRHLIARVEGDGLASSMELEDLGQPLGTSLGTMRGKDGAVVAIILTAPQGPAHLWRTEDGSTWTDLGPWDLPVGASGDVYYMGKVDGRFHVEFHPSATGTMETAWRSDDGLEWTEVFGDVPPDSNIIEVDSGVIAQQWTDDGERWLASPDGRTWEPLDLAQLGVRVGGEDTQFDYGEVGDTAFIVVDQADGRRDMWILSFDTVQR